MTMQLFKTIIVPDEAYTNNAFINSCLIYADKLIISPYINPLPDENLINGKYKQFSDKFDLDFNQAKSKLNQILEIRGKLEILEREGIVEKWVTEESIIGFNEAGDLFQSLTKKVLSHRDEINDIKIGSLDCSIWAEDGFNISKKNNIEEDINYPFYVLHIIQRLMAAYRTSSQISTYNLIHHKAINSIQKLAFDQPKVMMRPYVTEMIKLVVPYIVCQNLENVIEIRERLKDFLNPFRIEICKLVAEIPEDIPPEEIHHHLQKVIDINIQLKINELQRYLAKPQYIFKNHLLPGFDSLAGAGVTIIGSILTGINLNSAILALPFIHFLGAGIKTQQEISQTKYFNPFTFAVLAKKYS